MSRLVPHPLNLDEEAVLSSGNPKMIKDKLKEIDSGQYIPIARIGIGCSFEGYLERLRGVGVDVGVDNNEFGFVEVAVDGDKLRELRVYRN